MSVCALCVRYVHEDKFVEELQARQRSSMSAALIVNFGGLGVGGGAECGGLRAWFADLWVGAFARLRVCAFAGLGVWAFGGLGVWGFWGFWGFGVWRPELVGVWGGLRVWAFAGLGVWV